MGIVKRFPKSWRVDVVVLRSGGRDANGDPRPEVSMPVKDCLIGPRTTRETGKSSDTVETALSLYRDPDPDFAFQSTDRIRTPSGEEYQVEGKPIVTPLGVEVPLLEV